MCWKTRATHNSICMEYSAYLVCACNFNTKRSVSNIYTCMWLIWHFETKSSFATQTIVTQHDYDCLFVFYLMCVFRVYFGWTLTNWSAAAKRQSFLINPIDGPADIQHLYAWIGQCELVHIDWFIKGHPLDNPSNKNQIDIPNVVNQLLAVYSIRKTSIDVSRSCMCMHSREITLQST